MSKARHAMTKDHYFGGVEGTVISAGGPGQRPGGGQVPVSSEDPAVAKAKKRSKTY